MATKKPSVPTAPKYSPAPKPTAPNGAATQYTQYFRDLTPIMFETARNNQKLQREGIYNLNRAATDVMVESAPRLASAQFGVESQYAPQYARLWTRIAKKADPDYFSNRSQLADTVERELGYGYELGDELSREVEQDIRGAQTARGNWFGPAPTADEAFRKASARRQLFNERQGAAFQFNQSRSPIDFFPSISQSTTSTQYVSPYIPASGGFDSSLPLALTGQQFDNQQNYFQNQLDSYRAGQDNLYRNFSAQNIAYGNQWNRYLYDTYGGVGGSTGNPWLGGGGGGGSSWWERALKGAATGAQEGSIGGAWGAIGGAIGGAVDGAFNGPIYQAHGLD